MGVGGERRAARGLLRACDRCDACVSQVPRNPPSHVLRLVEYAAADNSRVSGRPNFFLCTQQQAVEVFATLKSLALLPSSSSSA